MPIIEIANYKEANPRYIYRLDTDTTPLGRGGMGVVYRGVQIDRKSGEQRDVAIKCLFNGLSHDVIERARSEASVRVKADNLLEMIDFVETQQPTPDGVITHYHVVSEYLDGIPLLKLLQGQVGDNKYAQKLYSLYLNDRRAFAIFIAKQVLYGLTALHSEGYIHRDVDPSNVMITTDEKVKLIDYGIAKNVKDTSPMGASKTQFGTTMGKAAYSSPELVSGDVSSHGFCSDIYSVGVMIFVIMSGQLPFTGTYTEIASQVLTKPTPIERISDKKLGKIIAKATNKKAGRRYASAADFVTALERVEKSKPLFDSEWAIFGAIAIAAIVIGILIGFLI